MAVKRCGRRDGPGQLNHARTNKAGGTEDTEPSHRGHGAEKVFGSVCSGSELWALCDKKFFTKVS